MQARPRIEERIEQVDEEIRRDHAERSHDDHANDHRKILVGDRLHRGIAEAGQSEDVLGDDGAAEQPADVDAELRDDRSQRGTERVSKDDDEVAMTPSANRRRVRFNLVVTCRSLASFGTNLVRRDPPPISFERTRIQRISHGPATHRNVAACVSR